jgi:hypothetical protein
MAPTHRPQCLYYLLNSAILEGFNLIFGTDVTLQQMFTTRGLETESAEGLLNITAVLFSFIAGCVSEASAAACSFGTGA